MDTAFFQKFLTQDDIDKLSTMPEQAISKLKSIFESAPGIGTNNGQGFAEIRAILHYHKAYTHIFIRELDMASGDFECCFVDSSGCPELRHANFKELIASGFHLDFDWDAKTSFSSAMFFKVPEPEEKIEIPEWYSYPLTAYWRGMATLRDALGVTANTIYLHWWAGFSQEWEEMEPGDEIPDYMPDDFMAGDSWYFKLEISQTPDFVYNLKARPDGENLRLDIASYPKCKSPETGNVNKARNDFTISRKDFVTSSALFWQIGKITTWARGIISANEI